MKLVTIIGARPQFIKAASFSNIFRIENEEIIVHTGQHYDQNMSDIFFEELSIPKPDYNLEIGSGSHGQQTGRMLESIEKILLEEKPDGVLVYGDTNSTLAGALASSKLHIPLFHVEAGLRSYNKLMPEEQNRIVTDHLSNLLLCPTKTSIDNLKKEGVSEGVLFTGDIMYDTVLRNYEISRLKYERVCLDNELIGDKSKIKKVTLKEFYLATIHRPENTDSTEKLTIIIETLSNLDKPVILPLHPRTKKIVNALKIDLNNIIVIDPVGYLMMLYLIKNSYMIITDSGGLQKEAFFLKTPCTTLRDQTEWIETLIDGWNVKCDINKKEILESVYRSQQFLDFEQNSFFGNGEAGIKISNAIKNYNYCK